MSYYATFTGRKIYASIITEKDICLADIGHHLTKICRYGGALPLDKHYSVATHSMNLSSYILDNNLGLEAARVALLHDASEAYLGDIVSGLKGHLPDYKKIESYVEQTIYNKYGVDFRTYKDLIKELDTRIVLDETLAFMGRNFLLYNRPLKHLEPLNVPIHEDRHLHSTKVAFLAMCDYLKIKD